MKIKRLIGGNLESNGYVIYNNSGGQGYIIDPGYNPQKFLDIVKEENIELLGILLTHHHYDHTGGVEKIRQAVGCKLYIHKNDADKLKMHADVMLEDKMTLIFGEEEIEVLHTPGHTAGGVCFWVRRHKTIFTGDTVFNVDLGRTDLDDGSSKQMESTCKNIIDKWENGETIYPGHGDPASMKFVRANNREFLDALQG